MKFTNEIIKATLPYKKNLFEISTEKGKFFYITIENEALSLGS